MPFMDVIELLFGNHNIAVFKRHFLSLLSTPRVLVKHAFTLGSISMHFFKQKWAYRRMVILCFLALNYVLIARFKVTFLTLKPAPVKKRNIN